MRSRVYLQSNTKYILKEFWRIISAIIHKGNMKWVDLKFIHCFSSIIPSIRKMLHKMPPIENLSFQWRIPSKYKMFAGGKYKIKNRKVNKN